jgi:hypothetical protein
MLDMNREILNTSYSKSLIYKISNIQVSFWMEQNTVLKNNNFLFLSWTQIM